VAARIETRITTLQTKLAKVQKRESKAPAFIAANCS
jgi:hypothetical protein